MPIQSQYFQRKFMSENLVISHLQILKLVRTALTYKSFVKFWYNVSPLAHKVTSQKLLLKPDSHLEKDFAKLNFYPVLSEKILTFVWLVF